jgi:hypothetical protein
MVNTISRFPGVPGFFRAACHRASRPGSRGYQDAARELCRALASLQPDACHGEEWDGELTVLSDLLLPTNPGSALIRYDVDNGDLILRWFDDHFPGCMALVPRERREAFLRGVYQAVEDGDIDLG